MVSIEESRVTQIDSEMNATPDCHRADLLSENQPTPSLQPDIAIASNSQSDPDEENRDPNPVSRNDVLPSPVSSTLGDVALSNAQNIPLNQPIDYDKIRRINQNLPTPNQDEPVGSTTNPIRIIQQGNQFVTTQNLSDDDLKQIIELLTNKSLINSSGRPNAIYNTQTNKRIVFRVTHARRRRNQPEDPADPDFNPDMPLEHAQPFPLMRNKRKNKRVSRPPRHLTKDYKRFKPEPVTEYKDEDSDIGYSDYDRGSDESWSPRNSDDESKRKQYIKAASAKSPPRKVREPSPPVVGPRQRKERKISDSDDDFECDYCERSFATRAGCVRHMRAKHDAVAATPGQTKTIREDGAPRIDAYMEAVRRRDRLKQAIDEASDDDLLKFALPRLSKLVSPWEHILIHSEIGDPPLPHIPSLIVQLMNLFEIATPFLAEHLVQQEDEPLQEPEKPISVDSVVALVDEDGEPPFANINTDGNDGGPKDLDDVICEELAPSATQSPEKSSTLQTDKSSTDIPASTEEEEAETTVVDECTTKPPPETDAQPSSHVTDTDDHLPTTSEEEINNPPVEEPVPNNVETKPDIDEDTVIVKIMNDEQSRALGLPLGRYTCSMKDLKETYLPRRYRSVLAEKKARLFSPPPSIAPPDNDGATSNIEDSVDLPSVEMEPDDTDMVESTEAAPSEASRPITDEDISSGRYMFVLNDENEPCDLVMEADTGKLFHRSTGAQVNLVDDEGRLVTGAVLPEDEEVEDKDIDPLSILNDSLDLTHQETSMIQETDEHIPAESTADEENNADGYIDIESLFPGISVSQVSETAYIVEKPDGARFHVDCGEDGLTYETLQAVLNMEEDES